MLQENFPVILFKRKEEGILMIKRIKILMTLFCILLCFIYSTSISKAETPRVMVSSYSLDKETIYPGDEFTLSFNLKNNSEYRVTNLKCTLSSPNAEFLPVKSVGTSYIDTIYGEEEESLSFKLKADASLKDAAYKLTIKTEYENYNGSYTAEDNIYIYVSLDASVSIAGVYIVEEEIKLGDNIEIMATINNTGKSEIYNVEAYVEGGNINKTNEYIGSIDAGKSSTLDIITKTTALQRGDRINKVYVTYKDKNGKEYKEEAMLGEYGVINVTAQDYSNSIVIKEKKKSPAKAVIIFLCITLAMLITVYFIVKRIIYKRKLSKEF